MLTRPIRFVASGRESEYHGIAIHPRHLSLWERWVQKRDRYYDPVADRQAKIAELRQVYEQLRAEKGKELGGESEGVDPDEASFVSEDVVRYFDSEKGIRSREGDVTPPGSGKTAAALNEKRVPPQ